MTTTAAGDVAVARLNKATEAFEKIITGASNQVVDVPGYGNQPTLAARVDERLDETTATAAAEANRSRDEADRSTTQANAAANSVTLATTEYNKAKTQADRAQSEADRAAQITGLSTVADAIGLAALPFPDVWIPLSDSLLMFAGQGREVKVGDDVVGRYVSFARASSAWYFDKSGVLRQAAINEPRYEAKGLLVEGPSTNLHKFSWFDGTYRTDQMPYNVNYSAVTDARFNFTVGRFSRDTTPAVTHAVINRNIAALAGVAYCGCALIKDDGAGSVELWLRDQSGLVNAARVVVDLVTGQTTTYSGGNFTQCYGGAIYKGGGWWLIWVTGTPPADVTIQNQFYIKNSLAEPGQPSEAVLCAFMQLEAAAFPSSYIHTTGAAATRAADYPFIPAINGGAEIATVAVTVSVNWASISAPNPAPRIFSVRAAGVSARAWDASIGPGSISSEINANNFGGLTNAGSVVANFKSGQVFTGIKTPAGLSTVTPSGRKDGSQGTSPGFEDAMYLGCQKAASTRHLNGHLRDLRIWHFELTDAQIKALR
jgi:hypothetical protein